jgi:hypothetical protein
VKKYTKNYTAEVLNFRSVGEKYKIVRENERDKEAKKDKLEGNKGVDTDRQDMWMGGWID